MAYIALYRKWRPMDFTDVVGQKQVSETLMRAIREDRVAHAYVFAGPRGTGKTSMAKILARAINCEHGPTDHPCNTCEQCRRITEGTALDVKEIDAASNRGIDEIRALRESTRFLPVEGRKKIFIIDEAHMLTTEAWNALLKTIEEPPDHIMFIFATTEQEKIPVTILSRCQRYMFKRITAQDIAEHLMHVAQSSDIQLDAGAAQLIAVQADGGLRDALSMLDQCASMGGATVTTTQVEQMLGLVGKAWIIDLLNHIHKGDGAAVLLSLYEAVQEGREAPQILETLAQHVRALLIAQALPDAEELMVYDTVKEAFLAQSQGIPLATMQYFIREIQQMQNDAKRVDNPRIVIEMGLLALCSRQQQAKDDWETRVAVLEDRVEQEAETLMQRMSRLETSGRVAGPRADAYGANGSGAPQMAQAGMMAPGQAGMMPQGQVGMMPPGQVGMTSPGQVGMMPPGQVGMTPPGQVGMVPPGQVGMMPPGQVGMMPPGQVGMVPPGQVGMTPPGQVGMTPPGQVGMTPPGQVGMMPPGQVGMTPPGQVGMVPPGAGPKKAMGSQTVARGTMGTTESGRKAHIGAHIEPVGTYRKLQGNVLQWLKAKKMGMQVGLYGLAQLIYVDEVKAVIAFNNDFTANMAQDPRQLDVVVQALSETMAKPMAVEIVTTGTKAYEEYRMAVRAMTKGGKPGGQAPNGAAQQGSGMPGATTPSMPNVSQAPSMVQATNAAPTGIASATPASMPNAAQQAGATTPSMVQVPNAAPTGIASATPASTPTMAQAPSAAPQAGATAPSIPNAAQAPNATSTPPAPDYGYVPEDIPFPTDEFGDGEPPVYDGQAPGEDSRVLSQGESKAVVVPLEKMEKIELDALSQAVGDDEDLKEVIAAVAAEYDGEIYVYKEEDK